MIFIIAAAVPGCQSAGGQAEAPGLFLAVTSYLERPAAALADAFNKIHTQGTPLKVSVVPAPEIRTVLEQGTASAVIDWQEPPAGNWTARIGWTGILIAVHPENPVEDLTSAQMRGIYIGGIDQWADVKGKPGKIHLLAYGPDQELEDLFEGIMLKGSRLSAGAEIVPSADAMLAAIARDPQSIGFLPGFLPASGVRILTIDTVSADYAQLISGKYPFRIPLYLDALEPVSTEILAFAGWVQSDPGQTILMEWNEQE